MHEDPLPLTVAGVLAGVNLIGMLLAAGTADRTGRPGAAVLGALSVAWFFTNQPMEGSVIVTLSETHGVTVADLVGLTGIGLAVWRWRRDDSRRR